jgi:hypothetical protein
MYVLITNMLYIHVHVCTCTCMFGLGLPEQAMGWLPLGFGIGSTEFPCRLVNGQQIDHMIVT